MALPLPSSLSPSKLSSFTKCALQFRFATIEDLPEPATLATVRGTLVHAALEHLFTLPEAQRVPDAAASCLDVARRRLADEPEWAEVGLDTDAEAVDSLLRDARRLVQNYFLLEDPRTVVPVGVELKLEVELGGLRIRGIIDRLDLVDGELVVTDYKTGRPPGDRYARTSMTGVHVYSLLCERYFGRRPVRVQLLHLSEPVAMVAEPTEQSTRGLERRLRAVWSAVEAACDQEDFRPRPSGLCTSCAFQRWCPSFGGDPDSARVDAGVRQRSAAGQEPLLTL